MLLGTSPSSTWRTPKNPVMLARVDLPHRLEFAQVRVANGIMVVNHERQGKMAMLLRRRPRIYDVSRLRRGRS